MSTKESKSKAKSSKTKPTLTAEPAPIDPPQQTSNDDDQTVSVIQVKETIITPDSSEPLSLSVLDDLRAKKRAKKAAKKARLAPLPIIDHPALEYLDQFNQGKFKFQKVRQTYLLENFYKEQNLPDTYWKIFLEYIKPLQGKAREETIAVCRDEILKHHIAAKRAQGIIQPVPQTKAGMETGVAKLRAMDVLNLFGIKFVNPDTIRSTSSSSSSSDSSSSSSSSDSSSSDDEPQSTPKTTTKASSVESTSKSSKPSKPTSTSLAVKTPTPQQLQADKKKRTRTRSRWSSSDGGSNSDSD